jgi:hypothetical protein
MKNFMSHCDLSGKNNQTSCSLLPGSSIFQRNLKRREIKKGKPNIAPLNHLPLLPSGPGGVQQELVVPACRGAKILAGKLNASIRGKIPAKSAVFCMDAGRRKAVSLYRPPR